MKQYFTIDKWVDILRKAGREEWGVMSLVALSRLSGLRDFTLRKAILRIEEKGMIERVGPSLYLNRFGRTTLEDMAMVLGKPCYISFESALSHYGIVSQEPFVLTCATTCKPRRKSTPLGDIVFRHIAQKRFWGYVANGSILWAEPEKAFLDWLYWSNKTQGIFPDLDEINWEEMNKKKIFSYSKKFPGSIQKFLKKDV